LTEHHVQIRAFSPEAQNAPGGSGLQALSLTELDPATYGPDYVAAKLLAPYTISLNGRQRFDLATGRASGPLDGPPTSHWMAVERDDDVYPDRTGAKPKHRTGCVAPQHDRRRG
jgi:hypothetical protein